MTNGYHNTKTTEDETFIFLVNAHTPIENQSNQDWNTSIHLKGNGSHIKVPVIFWFLIMISYLCFYHQLWVKWVCIDTGSSSDILDKLIHDSQNICGSLTLNEMHIKLTS